MSASNKHTESGLKAMFKLDLLEVARSMDCRGYSKLKKADLIQFILNCQAGGSSTASSSSQTTKSPSSSRDSHKAKQLLMQLHTTTGSIAPQVKNILGLYIRVKTDPRDDIQFDSLANLEYVKYDKVNKRNDFVEGFTLDILYRISEMVMHRRDSQIGYDLSNLNSDIDEMFVEAENGLLTEEKVRTYINLISKVKKCLKLINEKTIQEIGYLESAARSYEESLEKLIY